LPVFGVTFPAVYGEWQFISDEHEARTNNDSRGIPGNDIAIKAMKEGTLQFPDGASSCVSQTSTPHPLTANLAVPLASAASAFSSGRLGRVAPSVGLVPSAVKRER
jgi:hypothetical protein